MDPLSVLGAVIAISQLAHAIKSSIDQFKGNKKRLEELIGDIIRSLDDLEKFSKAHLATHPNESLDVSAQLREALSKLQRDMTMLLTSCHKLVPRNDGGQMSRVKASVKAWQKRDELGAEMSRIKELITSFYAQFTAFTAARVETVSYRMEQSIMVRGVEHRAHLQRLEVLVTNVLLDTRFGQQVMRQVGNVISSGVSLGSIEHDYLCLQLGNVLTMIEAHPAYKGPFADSIDEEVVAFECVHLPRVPHDHVVTGVLMLSRSLHATESSLTVKPMVRDLETVAYRLSELGMAQHAVAVQKTIVQIYRNLVSGGSMSSLPDLAHGLSLLGNYFGAIGLRDSAMVASGDSVAAFRLICETYPDLDFRQLVASSLRNRGEALALGWNDSEGAVAFEESTAIYAELLDEIQQGTRPASFTDYFSALLASIAYSELHFRQGNYIAAYDMLKVSLSRLSQISKQDLDGHELWNQPSRLFQQLATQLLALYQTDIGASLSIAEDVVALYRQLADTDPHRFSPCYLRCLYAYAYLCHFSVAKEADTVTLGPEFTDIYRSIFDQTFVYSNVEHFMTVTSFRTAIKRLQDTENGIQTINEGIYAYLTLEDEAFHHHNNLSLSDNIRRFIVYLFVIYPDMALETATKATSHILSLKGSRQPLLLRTLALLRDASGQSDSSFRFRFAQQSEVVLKHCQKDLHEVDVCQSLVYHGYTLINVGRESEGMGVIEEAIDKYRVLLPDSATTRSECISCQIEYAAFLHTSGRYQSALELYKEAVELCTQSLLEEPTNQALITLYASTLLQICEHLLASNSQALATSLASTAYQLLVSTQYYPLTPNQPTLNTVLIQCLQLSGLHEDAFAVAGRAIAAAEGGTGTTVHIEAQPRLAEHLIHWYALRDHQNQIQAILEKAYATMSKESMGNKIPPTALGLRHDTLAIIAFHYASVGQPENVLPFAKAAVQTYSKAQPRNAAEDMQYLESICDVAASLWNAGKQDDATTLLGLVAHSGPEGIPTEPPCNDAAGATPQIQLSPEVVNAFSSKSVRDSLRACMASYISNGSNPLETVDPRMDGLSETIQSIMALVDRVSKELALSPTDQVGKGQDADADSEPQPPSPPPYPSQGDPDTKIPSLDDTKTSHDETAATESNSPPTPTFQPASSSPTSVSPSKAGYWCSLTEIKHKITLLANVLFIIWVLSNCSMFLSQRFVSLLDGVRKLYPS